MRFPIVRLAGEYVECKELPKECPKCSNKEHYQQKDFRRSVGLTIVFSASAATCVLLFQGYNWFVVWSPMFLALIIDRTFAATSPNVVVCYNCGLIYRGLGKEKVEEVAPFDLDVHDRIHYKDRQEAE